MWLLFDSRKKNAMIYTMATVAGISCVPGGMVALLSNSSSFILLQTVASLPVISLLVAVGMYVLNDLTDVGTDQANKRRDRPLASGLVSKRDAILFVLVTNVLAFGLAVGTGNIATIVSLIPLLALGPLYSLPGIALKDRFLAKTLAIAAGMVLCLVLGATANFSSHPSQQWSYMFYGASMVGMMIFVTSPYNDLADVVGDSKSGRRTIPLVLGQKRTLWLIAGIASCMSAVSWVLSFQGTISWLTSAFQTGVSAIALGIIAKTPDSFSNQGVVRKLHSKLAPLHTLVHAGIIFGSLML